MPNGQRVHDEFILADALVAKLDMLKWSMKFQPVMIQDKDPLGGVSKIGELEPWEKMRGLW